MPIYTKKGDKGKTGLIDGTRVSKSDALIEAIGSVDELNAQLGVSSFKFKSLKTIQSDLFSIGSQLAGYKTKIDLEKRVLEMEEEIDKMWREMPPLKNFILPSGPIHVARAVCRRAERRIVAVSSKQLAVSIKYLNRLSDYLFCLARWVNFKSGKKDVLWRRN